MRRRRRYPAVAGEGLRVVARLLRESVWDMSGSDDYGSVLDTMTEGFRALRIAYDGCGIYVVDSDTDPPAVVSQYILRDGTWRQALPARDREAAIAVWHGAAATYLADLCQEEPELEAPLHLRFGCPMRSVVDVPFANGVLTVVSRRVDGFRQRDIEVLRDLAEGLPPLFYRIAELQQQESLDRQVEYAQRQEMVGQLAADMAHEVNNFLTLMIGQSQLLLLDEMEPSRREALEALVRMGESTQALTRRVLEMVRGHAPHRKTVDLNGLVHESLQLLRRQLQRDNVDLVEDYSVEALFVHVQSGQIQQVLLNLVKNSRDAVTAGGRRGGRISVRTWEADGVVRLVVEDDGPGVPEHVRQRIFEAFFTTKDTGKGTGLGLSVSRRIAASHGGDLHVEDGADGRGACFVLELPAAAPGALSALN